MLCFLQRYIYQKAAFFLGIAIGPLIAGFMSQIAFYLPFLIGGVMLLLGAGIVQLFVPETHHP